MKGKFHFPKFSPFSPVRIFYQTQQNRTIRETSFQSGIFVTQNGMDRRGVVYFSIGKRKKTCDKQIFQFDVMNWMYTNRSHRIGYQSKNNRASERVGGREKERNRAKNWMKNFRRCETMMLSYRLYRERPRNSRIMCCFLCVSRLCYFQYPKPEINVYLSYSVQPVNNMILEHNSPADSGMFSFWMNDLSLMRLSTWVHFGVVGRWNDRGLGRPYQRNTRNTHTPRHTK